MRIMVCGPRPLPPSDISPEEGTGRMKMPQPWQNPGGMPPGWAPLAETAAPAVDG